MDLDSAASGLWLVAEVTQTIPPRFTFNTYAEDLRPIGEQKGAILVLLCIRATEFYWLLKPLCSFQLVCLPWWASSFFYASSSSVVFLCPADEEGKTTSRVIIYLVCFHKMYVLSSISNQINEKMRLNSSLQPGQSKASAKPVGVLATLRCHSNRCMFMSSSIRLCAGCLVTSTELMHNSKCIEQPKTMCAKQSYESKEIMIRGHTDPNRPNSQL